MSSPLSHAVTSAGAQAGGGWLYGRSTDLLLGAGAGYVISVPLLVRVGLAGMNAWSIAWSCSSVSS